MKTQLTLKVKGSTATSTKVRPAKEAKVKKAVAVKPAAKKKVVEVKAAPAPKATKPVSTWKPFVASRKVASVNHLKATRSLSALIKYAQGEGREDVKATLGESYPIDSVTPKTFVSKATQKELKKRDGSNRELFTFGTLLTVLRRS